MAGQPVALDAQGLVDGPKVALEGARLAAADGIRVRVFGPASLSPSDGVEIQQSDEWIANDADPVAAVRSTAGASIVRAAADVAEGRAGALVSGGSTGATMTAALFAMRRLKGVHRPALAAQVPLPTSADGGRGAPGILLFLDVGANTEVRPQHLVQFAHLGAAFSESVLGVTSPRVALLSVGEERKKGNPDVVEAHSALAGHPAIEFIGNVEGRDLLTGAADVVVTDGFTGNVTLKTLEGTARAVAAAVRDAARSGPLAAAGGLLLRPALGGLRSSLDPNAVGGAVLLGLRGVAVVAHGSSSPEGIANAIRLADRTVREDAVGRTARALQAAGATRKTLRDTPARRGQE
ncbi:MAG TPA: phosphate acyltransferase PlsX [Solirubrobacterales bacterium]|nr:phosphate acyltransferase PlsX [Solirubrobacterales bacterium]